jgi:hypothetical protein
LELGHENKATQANPVCICLALKALSPLNWASPHDFSPVQACAESAIQYSATSLHQGHRVYESFFDSLKQLAVSIRI